MMNKKNFDELNNLQLQILNKLESEITVKIEFTSLELMCLESCLNDKYYELVDHPEKRSKTFNNLHNKLMDASEEFYLKNKGK